MDELKRFCNTCDKEKDIIEIETDPNGETVKLSCGHRHISYVTTALIKITAQVETKSKHKNALGKLLEKYKTGISGESKRPFKWIMKIDREQRITIHTVEELNKNGEWELVHDKTEPFKEKKQKRG